MNELAPTTPQILVEAQEYSSANLLVGVAASRKTTIAAGGLICYQFEVDQVEQLQRLSAYFFKQKIETRVLGAGSNVMFPDRDFLVPVITLGRSFRSWRRLDQQRIEVSGAMSVMTLAREVAALGLSGLEFSAGIPASLGGAIAMNAGAHQHEFSEMIESVTVVLPTGQLETISQKDLNFNYRKTELPLGSVVISSVLRLEPGDSATIREHMQHNLAYRKKTQPLQFASCGSVFRNPERAFAGELIEACGLKGKKMGEAEISEQHANWIINRNKQATSADVFGLIRLAQASVLERFGISLEPELQLW